jgi:hypothetical protein
MPDFEDAIGDMVTDLHAEAGRTVTYRREGRVLGTLTMSRHRQVSQVVDNGQGGFVEITPIDFVGKTSELLVDPPLRGDQIVVGSEVYDVRPTTSEKVFRRIGDQMTRIHTKQVAS